MPTFLYVQKARPSSVRVEKSKTSILSASWSKPSIMKWKRKSKFWKTAVKYSRQPCCLTLKKAKLVWCVWKKMRTITAISQIRICCQSLFQTANCRKLKSKCLNCHMKWQRVLLPITACLTMMRVCWLPAAPKLPILKKRPKPAAKVNWRRTGWTASLPLPWTKKVWNWLKARLQLHALPSWLLKLQMEH